MPYVIGISTRKYSRKEIFISAVMLLSGIMTLLITKQYTFLITCIAAIGIKKADVDRLMKNVCSIRTMCFGSIFCLALLNIIDRDQVEIWRNTGYVSRYGMGYGHPNILHLTLFIVLTLNYYLNIETIGVLPICSGIMKLAGPPWVITIRASATFLIIC